MGQCMQEYYITSIQALYWLFFTLIGSSMEEVPLVVWIVQGQKVLALAPTLPVYEIFVFGRNWFT